MSAPVADLFPETVSHVDEDAAFDERYTTRETIAWCMRKAGCPRIDLDVAACAESHWAERYYTKADDGLARPWFPGDVAWDWCNQPYSDVWPWAEKAWREVPSCPAGGGIMMLIPATRTEQPGWQAEIEPYRDGREERVRGVTLSSDFLPGRTAFARPGSGGVGQSGAPFGCVLLTWRRVA